MVSQVPDMLVLNCVIIGAEMNAEKWEISHVSNIVNTTENAVEMSDIAKTSIQLDDRKPMLISTKCFKKTSSKGNFGKKLKIFIIYNIG